MGAGGPRNRTKKAHDSSGVIVVQFAFRPSMWDGHEQSVVIVLLSRGVVLHR